VCWCGGCGGAEVILEGTGEWEKVRGLDLLRYRSYADSRDHIERTVIGSPMPIKLFPDLQDVERNDAWVASTNKLGAPATYCQAFLAVDWLVERYGSAKLTEVLSPVSLGRQPPGHRRPVSPLPYRQL